MKKLSLYDRINAASLTMVSPEWRQVRSAQRGATSFDIPSVAIPTETRTVNGRTVRIAEAGPTGAPLVVLLSPFPESILSFAASWEALTASFRVIAIDLPGFGASEGDRTDMSPNALADGLAAIFEELDLRAIHLVGPDVGMGAALAYAVNHDTGRLASLVVGNGPGAPGPFKLGRLISAMARFGALRWTTGLLGAGPLVAFTTRMGAIRHRPSAEQIDDYKTAYAGRAGEVVHWFADFRSKASELANRVPTIEVPTKIFWGDLDVLFHVSNAEYLHAALPNSELQILPEAGHLAWNDQPEMFQAMIVDWVEGGYRTIGGSDS